jgi:hypothetical protein
MADAEQGDDASADRGCGVLLWMTVLALVGSVIVAYSIRQRRGI